MTFRNFFHRIFFCFIFFIFLCAIGFILFKPIYVANSIIIPYSLEPYDICITNPYLWKNIKLYSAYFYIASSTICSNYLYILFFHDKSKRKKIHKNTNKNIVKSINNTDLLLFVGKNENDNFVFIPEKSLYQNILITGTIGTGKTSSCMYPFTKQLMNYKKDDINSKIGMLILDVKGNYYREVINFAHSSNRLNDLYVIELNR